MLRPIEIPIGPSIAYVPLTQGLYALIDSEDIERVGQHAWHAAWNGSSRHFYARRRLGRGHEFLHAFIFGNLQGYTADHVSSERTLDNRKCNLRHASRFQQAQNRQKAPKRSTPYRGIFWEPRKGLWRVLLRANGKLYSGGRHKSEIRAAHKYDELARTHHREFARLNFPGG